MPDGPVLHHVNLKTTRMHEMIDWYARVVGMEPSWIAPDACWLTNDAANHRLAMLAVPGLTDDADKIAAHTKAYEDRFLSPFVAAERDYVDEVIMPHSTRRRVARALKMLRNKDLENPWKKHDNIPL